MTVDVVKVDSFAQLADVRIFCSETPAAAAFDAAASRVEWAENFLISTPASPSCFFNQPEMVKLTTDLCGFTHAITRLVHVDAERSGSIHIEEHAGHVIELGIVTSW